jgi:hypothetical protein
MHHRLFGVSVMAVGMSLGAPVLVECLSSFRHESSTHPAQSKASSAGSWKAPRTPWGHPDLQGYTRSWKASVPMVQIDGPIFEYACHEGSYGMAGILRGARAEEQAVEGAANRR